MIEARRQTSFERRPHVALGMDFPAEATFRRASPIWWYVIAATIGLVVGLGSFTFYQAKGHSYLFDSPLVCVNCHVMQEQHDAYQHSSHRFVAGCNDCHTPKGFVPKWASTALNCFNHASAFTRGDFHEPIMANAFNRQVALGRCVDCHDATATDMGVHPAELDAVSCIRCHGNVGHRTRE